MIRVNLLPSKREQKRGSASSGEASQMWLAVVGAAVLLQVVALVFWYKSEEDQLAKQTKHNQEVEAQIADIKRLTANHDEIKAQLKELRDREDAITKLETARTGPTAVLLEVSHLLTAGRGPTVDRDKVEQLKRDNPGAVPNPTWDTRRLFMTGSSDISRVVRIQGVARDGEDVSEFLRRLTLSDYFADVRLLPASKVNDSGAQLVHFELAARAKY